MLVGSGTSPTGDCRRAAGRSAEVATPGVVVRLVVRRAPVISQDDVIGRVDDAVVVEVAVGLRGGRIPGKTPWSVTVKSQLSR